MDSRKQNYYVLKSQEAAKQEFNPINLQNQFLDAINKVLC
jgi:hypothetical protein